MSKKKFSMYKILFHPITVFLSGFFGTVCYYDAPDWVSYLMQYDWYYFKGFLVCGLFSYMFLVFLTREKKLI
jgi:hypothetical protein